MSAVSNFHTTFGKDKFRYRFKYETSMVGAELGNMYDELRGYNDYNIGFGGKVPLMNRIPFIDGVYWWMSGQFSDNQAYRVYDFDDKVYGDVLEDNTEQLVTPWDTVPGLRGFRFDRTADVFGKLNLNMLNNKLRIKYSYWEVDAHRKGFNTRYLYWDDGQNEIFRDTYRHTLEINHTVSNKTFYTVRYSNFIQDQFIGTRWLDSDGDGYPDWFENSYAAGSPYFNYPFITDMSSDVNNADQIPFDPKQTVTPNEIEYTNKDGNGPNQWTSGWFYGADPGNYNWEVAEDFIDVNGDGVYTEFYDTDGDGVRDLDEPWIDIFKHEHYIDANQNGEYDVGEYFTDYDNDGFWDAYDGSQDAQYGNPNFDTNNDGVWREPELLEEAIFRDGSYWLTPEMYVDYENFLDETVFWNNIQNDPYYANVSEYSATSFNQNYFQWWTEERAFGGTDAFYSTSRARTSEIRLDLTSQITDKWRTRIGTDFKVHKLNFYEIKNPWDDGSAVRQRFAEFWLDDGVDGINKLDDIDDNFEADYGEGNGSWDCDSEGNCEEYNDFNGDGTWNDYVEPLEIAGYWQNTFEVPWMVINAGIRIDGVNYRTKIWREIICVWVTPNLCSIIHPINTYPCINYHPWNLKCILPVTSYF
jgi:hypothetical protein